MINGILDAISALLIDITDPFRALIMAAYEILKDIIEDFLGSGAYLYTDAPGLVTTQAALVNLGMKEQPIDPWLAGGTPRVAAAPEDGFGAWAARFRQSFDDAGDDHRPTFSDGAPVTAVFIVAAAPQLPDLARFTSLFSTLLDTSKFEKAVDDFRPSSSGPTTRTAAVCSHVRWLRTGGRGGCATSGPRTTRCVSWRRSPRC